MPTYNTEAIILKRTNFGEADRLVTAFSKSGGKIKFIAKGVRRTKSRMAGSIEPFCLTSLMLAKGRNLDVLASASVIKNYINEDFSLEKIKFANYVGEVLDRLTSNEVGNEDFFNLAVEVLARLDSIEIEKLRIYFVAKFFCAYGVIPEFSCCVRCGNVISQDAYFSKAAGGLLDENCLNTYGDTASIGANTIKVLRIAQANPLSYLSRVKIPTQTTIEAMSILNSFMKYSLLDNIKSDQI